MDRCNPLLWGLLLLVGAGFAKADRAYSASLRSGRLLALILLFPFLPIQLTFTSRIHLIIYAIQFKILFYVLPLPFLRSFSDSNLLHRFADFLSYRRLRYTVLQLQHSIFRGQATSNSATKGGVSVLNLALHGHFALTGFPIGPPLSKSSPHCPILLNISLPHRRSIAFKNKVNELANETKITIIRIRRPGSIRVRTGACCTKNHLHAIWVSFLCNIFVLLTFSLS